MAPFQGDTTFRNRALNNFHFYRRLFTSDYRKIIAINRKGEAATKADIEAIQSIQEKLEAEEAELDKLLSNAQSDFAKRNKMPLLENDVQKKIGSVQ
jgi:23S rRNA maturation mini-RNase III